MGYDPERDQATQRRLRDAYVGMAAHFHRVVAARRATPRDDLITAMVRAQEQEDRLTDLEIISLCTQLMVAGNVTTTDLIGNGLYALLSHPEQLALLRARPAGRLNAPYSGVILGRALRLRADAGLFAAATA